MAHAFPLLKCKLKLNITMTKFVDVVINRPIEGPFTYYIPKDLEGPVDIGSCVEVSFGKKKVVGYVVGFPSDCKFKNIKPLLCLLDRKAAINDEILKLTKWIADYYYSTWGEAISAAVPSVLKRGPRKKRLKTEGSRLKEPEAEYIDGSNKHLLPTYEQRQALASIKQCIDDKIHKVFLLHGVTGSGKTEVYLQSISHALDSGHSSIILVPEISLTPQTVARFKARFGERIAILHSQLVGSKRTSEWERIISGEAQIVVGARSAIFAPLKNLGLVVVDEEHENTYKQEDAPRYHAREVAIKRAEISGAVVILGSATPSLESFFLAEKKCYTLVELPERIDSKLLPEVEIVDMREELTRSKKIPLLSQSLKEWIRKDLAEDKQIILFLNRRGFSTFISCRKCGYVLRCKRCDVSLTYHFHAKKLICHHCKFTMDPPTICPECNSSYVKLGHRDREGRERDKQAFPECSDIQNGHRLDAQARDAREGSVKVQGRQDRCPGRNADDSQGP